MSTQLQKHRRRLQTMREQQLQLFSVAATERQQRRMQYVCARIAQTNDFLRSLDEIERELAQRDNPGRPRYLVSSVFLYSSYKKLTADRDEQFFFVTGCEVRSTLILDQWAEFAHEKRTVVGVTADVRSTHKLLIKLENFGHRLLGHFHSHPGNGPSSTKPSSTDDNFQRRLELAGHLAVMAIFSRDGFVRFVRFDGTPDVEVHGKGVEKHDASAALFRLTEIDCF